jgi:hypothetical protein
MQGFGQALCDFFQDQPRGGESALINLDGKTMRSTIPEGKAQGMHLLASHRP